ncbi:glycerol-3-phosphate 1-O-acyltransferase PlsY [Candidatus Bandiella numerosa]|uniref:glycerol-3-phosphate 1-O-acyltransferase PlsY n=1 Tax=Candidatus Bandiella numerosa TaxID=2570586 RepID=UPI001F015CFA|nr:glycerol-3-phosphate 1-O-acyltransferase PlsY [Candidatus Bandiella numerosa]
MQIHFFLLLISYLLGSIPSGLILSRILKKGDIRKSGSGNIGATNALRVGGRLLGALTLIFDLLKGLIAVIIAIVFEQKFIAVYGFVCILGHIFPVWLKFKGGKGVATVLGVILGLNPLVGLAMAIIWVITFICFKISSVASLTSLFLATFALIITDTNYGNSIFIILILTLIVYKHKDNMIRLYRGEESKISL